MTGFLSLFGGTVVLDVLTGKEIDGAAEKPEWWAEVTKTLAQGDFDKAQVYLVGNAGIQATAGDPENAVMSQKMDLLGYQRTLVEAALVEWNLTDEAGDRLPIANLEDRKRSIAKLPPAAFNAIYMVVQKHNRPGGAAEQAAFHKGAHDGGADGVGGAAGDAGVPDGGSVVQEARA